MIRHIVLLAIPPDHDPDELHAIMHELAAMADHLPGFDNFEHGPNRDFEDRSARYPYGFIGTFTDADALQTYAQDARHSALGQRLVEMCGDDGIMVIDLEISA